MIETTKYIPYNYSITVDNFPYFVNNYLANNLVNFNKFRIFAERTTDYGLRTTDYYYI